ncbi:hypothetical protein S7711_03711 [Stachybotrys chartarum IBT 7711]|uniref:Velvet domain-containing protein n=1 Tax=Stachybotrys chartarum (strain CBS 109288 / IBT 7711) TaxID=1280523 RepID=A0A084B7M3_STACB|nr:hypothetical protein S7711_03711 [Stachybotrys chartarum IBT 7711]KFA48241.1 hypothetical protein S40293_07366 [Stachybotrys chartarum IBT 40293]
MPRASIVRQPPRQPPLNAPMSPQPSVELLVKNSRASAYYYCMATLVDVHGQVIDHGLAGENMPGGVAGRSSEEKTPIIFQFADLEVALVGHFAIRMDMYKMDHTGSSLMAQATTRNFEVRNY